MTIDPSARLVHSRRRYSYQDAGGFNESVKREEFHRGVFELRYGHPTNVDAVWKDRMYEQEQKQ